MTFFFYWLQILGAMLFGAGLGRLFDWAFALRPNPLADICTALAGIGVALAAAWAAAP